MSDADFSLVRTPEYWITNALSAVGTLIMIYGGIRNKVTFLKGDAGLRFVLLLSFSDFIISILNLVTPLIGANRDSCQIIAFIKVFCIWTGLTWCSWISLLTYLSLKNRNMDIERLYKYLVFMGITVSLIIAATPLINLGDLEYINSQGYCEAYYSKDRHSQGTEILSFFVLRGSLYIFALVITIMAYIRVFYVYKDIPKDYRKVHNFSARKLLFYPTTQLIIHTPVSVSMLIAIWMTIGELWTRIWSAWFALSGFVTFLVYGRQFLISRSKSKQGKESTFICEQDPYLQNEEDSSGP